MGRGCTKELQKVEVKEALLPTSLISLDIFVVSKREQNKA
jgi:hypothetical protein